MSKRYPLLFNPKARSQRAQRATSFIIENATHFALYATNSPDEARDLAARFASQGEPVVIAAGGDGTLNAVVQGLAGTETALGVMPAGTMNVFARELGIPNGNLQQAFEVIQRGHLRHIDLFEVNGTPFMQMAGVGFDAMVIEETTWESKKMLGPLAYLLAAVKVLGESPPNMTLRCSDGREVEGIAVLAGNGTLYGGQMPLFRLADNQDQKLDVLVFKESGYRMVLDSLAGLARGGIDLSDSVTHLQTQCFEVESAESFPIQVDGELLGRAVQARFQPAKHRLRVLTPVEPINSRFADAVKNLWSWTRMWQHDEKTD